VYCVFVDVCMIDYYAPMDDIVYDAMYIDNELMNIVE
jgi:hypothetical protein